MRRNDNIIYNPAERGRERPMEELLTTVGDGGMKSGLQKAGMAGQGERDERLNGGREKKAQPPICANPLQATHKDLWCLCNMLAVFETQVGRIMEIGGMQHRAADTGNQPAK